MRRLKVYAKTFAFLLIAEIISILLVILMWQFPGLKFLNPINQITLLGPALAAFLMTFLSKNKSLRNLRFSRINIHVLYVILIYLLYVAIVAIIQILLGNISFHIGSNVFEIYGEAVGFKSFIIKAGLLTILFSGFGEEIGWRGYLFDELKGLPYLEMTILLNVIWALWHLPMFFFGMGHGNVFVSFTLFVIMCIEFGIILNYIRMKTNSVFGAILVHPIANISG
ncbi:MAG: type II CAAX endopeptidase family protein [Bacteroidales bacterium]|jgi:membrane protease YdiL (CAAX protease family)